LKENFIKRKDFEAAPEAINAFKKKIEKQKLFIFIPIQLK